MPPPSGGAGHAEKGNDIDPLLIRIFDEDPISEEEERAILDIHTAAAVAAGTSREKIVDAPLLATIDTIESIVATAVSGREAAIIDISSFPKRWFFVIARLMKENKSIKDLLFTYSPGTRYANILSSNPEIIRTIPTFTSLERRTTCDVAFVGIGYHSHSVIELFDIERPKSVTMLFPFPPGPPGIARNWKFVERLEVSIRSDSVANEDMELGGMGHLHVGALDLPQILTHSKELRTTGRGHPLLLPTVQNPFPSQCVFSRWPPRAPANLKYLLTMHNQPGTLWIIRPVSIPAIKVQLFMDIRPG